MTRLSLAAAFVTVFSLTGHNAQAAERILFSSLASLSPTEKSAVTAYCDGDPQKDAELTCRLVQQSVWGGKSASEIAKSKASFEAMLKKPGEVDKYLAEMCRALAQPRTHEQQKKYEQHMAFPAVAEAVSLYRRVCSSPKPNVALFKQLSLKAFENEATVCRVHAPREWRTRFFKQSERLFKSEPSAAAIDLNNSTCGAVTVEMLEVSEDGFWTYRTKRAYLNKDGDPNCAHAPDTLELVYTRDSPGQFPLNCSAVKFGLF